MKFSNQEENTVSTLEKMPVAWMCVGLQICCNCKMYDDELKINEN